MQTAGGPGGRCAGSTLLPKRFPNTSQAPPGHLPGVSHTRGAGWARGVRWARQVSVSLCHRSARLDPGSTAHGISIPRGSARCAVLGSSLQLPGAQWTPVWCVAHLLVSCRRCLDPELPSACATSPSGHCCNSRVSRVAWAKPRPCRSSSATPWWGHVRPPPCTGDTDPALGCSCEPCGSCVPTPGAPRGLQGCRELSSQGTAWPWVGPTAVVPNPTARAPSCHRAPLCPCDTQHVLGCRALVPQCPDPSRI